MQSSANEMVQNHGGLEDFPSSPRQPSSTATFNNRFASSWTITGPSGLNTGEFLQAVHQAAAALRNDNEMTMKWRAAWQGANLLGVLIDANQYVYHCVSTCCCVSPVLIHVRNKSVAPWETRTTKRMGYWWNSRLYVVQRLSNII